MNIVNGGVHADNPVDSRIHDPAHGRAPLRRGAALGSEIFHALKAQLKSAGHNTNVGDEGGLRANLRSAEECLSFIMQASSASA